MKVSGSQVSSVAVSLALWFNVATAHPHERMKTRCQSEDVVAQIVCGDAVMVKDCITYTGSDESRLGDCLVGAGCTQEQAQVEAVWTAKRCQGGQESEEGVEKVIIELRDVQLEDRADSSTTTTSSTSSSETTTSTSETTSTSSTSATSSTDSTTSTATSSSTTSTASSSSTTASSTSSSTASSTSSSATSTSTSSSSSSGTGFGAWSYIIAAVMGIYVAVCMGCICWKCCSERNERKKAAKLAEEKEALALMKS